MITEVWAQLLLSQQDVARIEEFLCITCGLRRRAVSRRMHLTVYHARRPMPQIVSGLESAQVFLPAVDTRLMVLAPGGENPRPELEPNCRSIGIRVHKQSDAYTHIQLYRSRLLAFETPKLLGKRKPSTANKSAFGARHFQAHMTLLKPGSGIDRDLTLVGCMFREKIGILTFDRFIIDVAIKTR